MGLGNVLLKYVAVPIARMVGKEIVDRVRKGDSEQEDEPKAEREGR